MSLPMFVYVCDWVGGCVWEFDFLYYGKNLRWFTVFFLIGVRKSLGRFFVFFSFIRIEKYNPVMGLWFRSVCVVFFSLMTGIGNTYIYTFSSRYHSFD